ncbi:hypothetical protein F5887DRAFT_1283551 [Amanita rubescens]|nr:hypothetical protein F5887DRAFT_1283551 [Amanita rubescens]
MLESDRNLPNETLVLIFSHLSQCDLTKVALVSHRFNAITERVLYSSIDIDENPIESSHVPKRTLGWCDAMKRNQLYDVPRKLSIRWVMYGKSNKALPHSCSALSDNIRRLTLLDTLELFIGHDIHDSEKYTSPALELVTRDLRLPNLRHCSLGAGPYWANFFSYCTPKPSDMHVFIASHSLRYLAFLQISESVLELIPHDALPELSIFYGTPSGASFILPGRPVHHLLLMGSEDDLSSENLSRMALTSVPLRILDLSAMYVSPSVLRDIATHFPTIEIFRVDLTTPIWGCCNLPEVSSYLALFKKLSWFDPSPTETTKKLGMDDQRSLCYDWHSICPSLRHVFYGNPVTMWQRNEDGHWFTCEPPTQGSADGLYRYTDTPIFW